MALTDENGGMNTTMLVSPAGNMGGMPYPVYQGNGGGNGMFGQDGWWIVLLIIIFAAFGGNWGGNNGVNGGFAGSGAPIVISDNNGGSVQRGFDQAAIMGGLNGLQAGISGLSTQLCGCCCDMQGTVNQGFAGVQQALCSGFAGTTAAVTGAQNAIAQQMYANQIADMERSFAAQTASAQGMSAIQAQLAQNGMNTQMGFADAKYTLASEACATRANSTQNTQGILNAINGGIQSIKDQLCQDKIDAKNDEIATLRQQIAMKDLAASQTAQNAFIAQGFSNEVDALYNRLNTCPVPTTPVYGRTPIFTCNQNSGCGCGCNGGF